MSKLASLLAESDAALAALTGVEETAAPAAARAAAATLGRLALAFEEMGQAGASLLLDEMAALCRGAAAASGEHRAALVAAVRESFATLCATGLATRAAVEAVPAVNRLRALRAAAPVRLAALLPGAAPDEDPLLPDGFPQRARQWRTWFQKGLTGWLRGQPEALELLRTVLARVAGLSAGAPAHADWRAATLFADALPGRPDAAASADRRRLMRLDTRLRALAEDPAAAFADGDPALAEELLGAVLGLRPHELAPRGAARAALLRRLRADLALYRAELAAASGRARRTVPAVARTVADTLALLECTAPRRQLLALGEQVRAAADNEANVAALSRIMYALESEARQAAGEPAAGAPPLLARELNALAEVLAESPVPGTVAAPSSGTASSSTGDATAPASRPAPAEMLAAVVDLEEGRDRLESAVGAARRRLLDVDDALAAMRESVLRLELASGRGAATEDALGTLRAQGAALATRFVDVQQMLREFQPPLAAQARSTQRLRHLLLDASTLENLSPMLAAHLRRATAAAGLRSSFESQGSGEPLHLPAQALGEALQAVIDALVERAVVATPLDADLRLRVVEARRGAWLLIAVELDGSELGSERLRELPVRLGEHARRLGGSLHVHADGRRSVCWLRLPHAESMRKLLRVEAGGLVLAAPVADVVAITRGGTGDAATPVLDLAALLGAAPATGEGAMLQIEAEGAPVGLRVDGVEELSPATPLALGAPLDQVSWLAGAALAGDGRVLPVLDIEEIALAALHAPSASGHG